MCWGEDLLFNVQSHQADDNEEEDLLEKENNELPKAEPGVL